MSLATRIRYARIDAGFSQRELAERLGVSQGALSNWERPLAVAKPPRKRLEAIAKECRLPITQFLEQS